MGHRLILAAVIVNAASVLWNGMTIAFGVAWYPVPLAILTTVNAVAAVFYAWLWARTRPTT